MNPRHLLTAGMFLVAVASCSRAASHRAAENASFPRPCATSDPSYATAVRPVIEHYCINCHSPDGVAGDEHDFTHPELLHAQRRLLSARLRTHGMPPATSVQPSAAEHALMLHWASCGAELD
jgi:uncharacterized membrane protein